MRKLKLFLDAKAANTPPRGISKASRVIFSVLTLLLLSIGQMWGAEVSVSWSASTGALGSAISSVGGTANGTIATTSGTEISYDWNYTRTLVTLKSGKSDYISMSGSYMQCGSSNAGENVEFRTSNIPGTIKSVTVLLGSKDSRHTGSITVGGTNYNAGDIPAWANSAGGNWVGTGTSSGEIVISIDCNSKKSPIYIASITVVYEEGGSTPTCSVPTFSPAAGSVAKGTTVALSTTTEGATIHYTTNGSDPTTSSATYSNPIAINADMTIKAIAAKTGMTTSNVASAAYTVLTPLTTMDDIFAAATAAGNTEADVCIDFQNWVVSGAKGNTAYVTDGTKGFVVYYSGHGFAEGDILSGVGSFKIKLYNGAAELTAKNSGTINKTTGGVAPLNELDASGISALSGINTGSLIKISGVATSTSELAGVKLYKTIYSESSLPNLSENHKYNVTGVYVQYGTTKELMPRTADDIEEIKHTVTYNAAPDHGTLTIKNGDDVVASGSAVYEGAELTILTSPAEGYKLAGVTVNGSAYAESTLTLSENVTIAASFEENEAPEITSFVLSVIGQETDMKDGQRVGDKVTLPANATACSKTFVGWDADADCDHVPTYAPGAEFTLAADNKLYAVYATATPGAAVSYPIDFEGNSDTYTDWTLTNITSKQTDSNVPAHGGSYFAVTAGTTTASLVTKAKIANPISLTVYVSKKTTNTTTSTWYAQVSENGSTWTNVESVNGASMSRGNWVELSADLSSYSNVYVRVYYSGSTAVRCIDDLVLSAQGPAVYSDYSTDCQAQVATPTFSPAAGTYTEVKNVTISTETADATIYYTLNGDEPSTSSTLYEGAIEVGEDMTIMAIAVKDGMANSAIASATYDINLPLSTMDQIFAAATAAGGTAVDANIAFGNWVVSGVSTNGKQVYVTDGTKGFIIFDNGGNMGFAVGNVLSGTVACKVQLYNGAAELTTLSSTTEGLNIATGGSVTPVEKAISALSGVNTGAPVIINSVQFDGTNLSDGANSIKPYNALFAYDALENGKYYNVTGIYLQFNQTKEILPRSAADIESISLSDPEISYTPASATITTNDALPATVFANPHELPISYSSNNDEVATVHPTTGVITKKTGTGTAVITASFAGNATYAAANVTYTLTVNEYVPFDNVVIIAEYDNKFYALTNSINNKTAAAVEIEKDGDNIIVPSAEAKVAIQWKKRTNGDNTTFQDSEDKYLKGVSNGGDLTVVDAVCNWNWNATDQYYYIGTRSFIYRESANGFKNYAVSNAGSSDYSTIAEVRVIDPENIVVTTKVDPQLAYSPASVTLTVGQTFVPAELTYAEGFDGLAAVTYASSNENVATVDENGDVSLVADAIGTATITATFAGNGNYLAGSASYLITVNEVGDDLSGQWVLVEDASVLAAGQKIIIMGVKDANVYTMGKQNSNPNRAAVASTLEDGVLNPGAMTKVFTLVAADGKFAIQASNDKYLSSATSGTSNNLIEAENYENDNAKWTITIGEEGVASIVAAAGNKTVMQMNYNNGNPLFSCYGSASQSPVKIFTNSTHRSGYTAGKLATICLPYAIAQEDIVGAEVYELAGKDPATGKIVFDQVISGGMEAGHPYLVQTTAESFTFYYSGAPVDAPVNDGALKGTFEQKAFAANASETENIYFFKERALWAAATTGVTVPAYRAYLDMSEVVDVNFNPAPGRRRITLGVQGTNVATGFENINASDKPMKLMIDGQIYILRGEKMFDVTGKLVK